MDPDQAFAGIDHGIHRQPLQAIEVQEPRTIDARGVEMLLDTLQPARADQLEGCLAQLRIGDRHLRNDAVADGIARDHRLRPGGEGGIADHVTRKEGHPLPLAGSAVGIGTAGAQRRGPTTHRRTVEMRGDGPRARALRSPSRRNCQDGPFDHVHAVSLSGPSGSGCVAKE